MSRAAGSATASVVTTQSMVARPGASIPAPLIIAPTVTPPAEAVACLAKVSVVRMASAASGPPC